MPLSLLQLMFPPDFTSCFDVTCFLQLGNLMQFNMGHAFVFMFRNELHAKKSGRKTMSFFATIISNLAAIGKSQQSLCGFNKHQLTRWSKVPVFPA